MNSVPWCLFEADANWLFLTDTNEEPLPITFSASDEPDSRERALEITETLCRNGYAGEPVVVGLQSSHCLSIAFGSSQPEGERDRQTLIYEAEGYLPLSAEQVVMDFVTDGSNVSAVAVDVSETDYRALFSALEDGGVNLLSIQPLALMAGQFELTCRDPDSIDALLWNEGRRGELLLVKAGKIVRWLTADRSPELILQHLQMMSLDYKKPLRLVTYSLETDLRRKLAAAEGAIIVEECEHSLIDAAASRVPQIVSGQSSWIELRQDALASPDPYRPIRSVLRRSAFASSLLLMMLSLWFLYRGNQYERLTRKLLQEQATIFADVFPEQAVPVGIRARLESELTRISGLRGASSELPKSFPTLPAIHALLEALSDAPKFRLFEIRGAANEFQLDGEVRSHTDADLLANALRQHDFGVPPPRTQTLADRVVSFSIVASWKHYDSEEKE